MISITGSETTEMKKDLKIEVIVLCTKHGKQDWIGHIGCTACGRIYSSTEILEMDFGEECECGEMIKPVPWWSKKLNEQCTGIPACPLCYLEQEEKK